MSHQSFLEDVVECLLVSERRKVLPSYKSGSSAEQRGRVIGCWSCGGRAVGEGQMKRRKVDQFLWVQLRSVRSCSAKRMFSQTRPRERERERERASSRYSPQHVSCQQMSYAINAVGHFPEAAAHLRASVLQLHVVLTRFALKRPSWTNRGTSCLQNKVLPAFRIRYVL